MQISPIASPMQCQTAPNLSTVNKAQPIATPEPQRTDMSQFSAMSILLLDKEDGVKDMLAMLLIVEAISESTAMMVVGCDQFQLNTMVNCSPFLQNNGGMISMTAGAPVGNMGAMFCG